MRWFVMLMATCVATVSATGAEPLQIGDLRCEYRRNPLGLHAARPRLSWLLNHSGFGARQTAYQIEAARSAALLESGELLWDSGKIASDQSIQIPYAGPRLSSRDRIHWRVRVWDGLGQPTPWSDTASFEMGLLSADDWRAEWIEHPDPAAAVEAAPLFRTEFDLAAGVARARAYVCGLGYHELYLNGRKVGPSVLEPAQTDYRKRALYVVHDITDLLQPGANAVGLWVGNGWFHQTKVYGHQPYGNPCGIVQIEIEQEDGSRQWLGTDAGWLTTTGPILANNVHLGEVYDARRELGDWSSPGYAASGWQPALVCDCPTTSLEPQLMPGIQVTEELAAVAITEPEPGKYIVDLGQNFAGWVRLRVQAAPGTQIDLRYAETLWPDGRLDPRSTGIPQADRYICRGGGVELWEPRFTYHGFRYVELTGCPSRPDLEMVTGVVLHTAADPVGQFDCSDPQLERIHRAVVWTLRGNLFGVPTDNPTRERCGWLGDAHVMAEATMMNFHLPQFWAKFRRDIDTSLIDDVVPTYVAPGQGNPGPASADWASALTQIPWYLYLHYGDRSVLEQHFDGCERWLARVRQELLDDDLIHRQVGWNVGLGDWLPPGGNSAIDTPVPLTSTALVYYDHHLMAKMAAVLGRPERAEFYHEFATRQKASYLTEFYDADQHSFGSQTGNALSLAFGLAPDGDEARVAERLAWQVRQQAGGRPTTGILGTRHLLCELSRYGHGEVALELLRRDEYPGFGWFFDHGATTLWENWGEWVIGEPEMPEDARNQAMRASIGVWFYEALCGLAPDPDQPGFKHFFVRPTGAGDLERVGATFHSPYGPIRLAWDHSGQVTHGEITVPVGCTATWTPPGSDFAAVRVNGQRPDEALGVLEVDPLRRTLRLGAGQYRVACP
jgi:alpha-L-rhamnosidase